MTARGTKAARPRLDAAAAEFRRDVHDPVRQVVFARHLLAHDPENLWTMGTLAAQAESHVEQIALLREAIRVGLRRWAPQMAGLVNAPDWGRDAEGFALLGCVRDYACTLIGSGHRSEAVQCLRFLLKLNPSDAIKAVKELAKFGLVLQPASVTAGSRCPGGTEGEGTLGPGKPS